MSKISVILSVYNSAQYLDQCVESILRQSFRDFELICVDDGSNDESGYILDRYKVRDERVRVIHKDRCSGSAAVPRNIGLENSKGEYVIILDSDDWFENTMLEKMLYAAESMQADLVMCDNYMVDENQEFIGSEGELHHSFIPDKKVFSSLDIPKTIFQISNATAWHKLIKRSLIENYNLRFQVQTPILDDIFFVNMIDALARRITIVDEKLVYYRLERPGSQTYRISKHPDSIHKAFCALYEGLMNEALYHIVSDSFKVWAINTYDWWLSSVTDYAVYSYLIGKYRNSWIRDLGLLSTDQNRLNNNLRVFCEMIVDGNYWPSRKELVESLKHSSRIALYGAGRFGKKAYDFINSYGKHKIVAWCDKNAANMHRNDIYTINELLSIDFDIVMISIQNIDVAKLAMEELIRIGIDENKIRIFR